MWCTLTGHVRVDDQSVVYVDGIQVGSTSHYLRPSSFTAPDDWKTLVIFGHILNGPSGITVSLGDDVYSDVTRWRGSSTYTPGWNDTGFEDSRWKCPILKYDSWTPPAEFNPKAEKIWSEDSGWDSFCRTDRMAYITCDIPLNRREVFYHSIPPDGSHSTYTHISNHLVIDAAICGGLCTDGATACLHSNGSVCVPPGGACCGFTYDDQQMSCDLYTIIPSCRSQPTFNSIYIAY